MMTLERNITDTILAYLNNLPGCRAIKIHGNQMQGSGHPDILATYRGRTLALEVKKPGGTPTALQQYNLAQWETAGAIAAVVESAGDVMRLLQLGDAA